MDLGDGVRSRGGTAAFLQWMDRWWEGGQQAVRAARAPEVVAAAVRALWVVVPASTA